MSEFHFSRLLCLVGSDARSRVPLFNHLLNIPSLLLRLPPTLWHPESLFLYF